LTAPSLYLYLNVYFSGEVKFVRIRIDEIPESGRTLRLHWEQDRLRQFVPRDDPFSLDLVQPLSVVLSLEKQQDHVRITGKIEGHLKVGCHRCLKPFPLFLNETVDIYLVERDRMPEEGDRELEPDETVCEFFDGEVIDVDHLVAEQIFLALPVKVLCSEDCKGICPGCGVNLNEDPCRCKAERVQSPFEKLESIRRGLSKSVE
jgi:uncharacterized protein